MKYSVITFMVFLSFSCRAQESGNAFVKANFTKIDTLIPMRDGVKLYTVIYIPNDANEKYPILMERTPYSAGPYGKDKMAGSLGPNDKLLHEKYIFVMQDVRGRYMSEGHNLEVTPHIANKKTNKEVDESSDTYDTVEWLLKNIPGHNGRVGLHGISYPGFYATACLPGAHPAIKAVSPQAPVTDEFIGDDANHNGAFFLLDNFGFMQFFGIPLTGPVSTYTPPIFTARYRDAYQFFLNMGPIKNSNGPKYFNGKSYIYNEYLEHDTYDAYWKSRNIRPHLKNIQPAVLVVGGWYDAEDLFGALRTYEAIEKQSPGNNNRIVMGPWTHGAWSSPNWTSFGTHEFGANTSAYFQDSLETRFFNYYLKDKGSFNAAEATMYDAGNKAWKEFAQWPPRQTAMTPYYLEAGQQLSVTKPAAATGFDEYLSDPAKPVPYTGGIYNRRNNGYMVEDQRFAAMRPDVLTYSTGVLENDLTLAGPLQVNFTVSTTGTDADFIVKLIEVLPDTLANIKTPPAGFQLAGMQRLVRAEVMRGKFRNSFEKPEPFVPGKPTPLSFMLNDVMHTFKKGTKLMVQVQSSWFPLVDRNPQTFVSIPRASEKDFQKATIRIYRNSKQASAILLPVFHQ